MEAQRPGLGLDIQPQAPVTRTIPQSQHSQEVDLDRFMIIGRVETVTRSVGGSLGYTANQAISFPVVLFDRRLRSSDLVDCLQTALKVKECKDLIDKEVDMYDNPEQDKNMVGISNRYVIDHRQIQSNVKKKVIRYHLYQLPLGTLR